MTRTRRGGRGVWTAIVTGITVLSLGSAAFAAAPANDKWRRATTIGSLPYTDSVSTVEATLERDEPMDCVGEGPSVWYEYTPSQSHTMTADTYGSDYDTVLGVYTGRRVSALTLIACNDDTNSLQSQVVFGATAGETYYIRVSGWAGSFGQAVLNAFEGEPEPPCLVIPIIGLCI